MAWSLALRCVTICAFSSSDSTDSCLLFYWINHCQLLQNAHERTKKEQISSNSSKFRDLFSSAYLCIHNSIVCIIIPHHFPSSFIWHLFFCTPWQQQKWPFVFSTPFTIDQKLFRQIAICFVNPIYTRLSTSLRTVVYLKSI